MKKIIILALILISAFSSLCAAESNTFSIYLNKNGTDEIWFSDSESSSGSQVSDYMFPIISATTTKNAKGETVETKTSDGDPISLTSSLYLHWRHQSDTKVEKLLITLSFVGDKDENASDTAGYMLNSAKNSDKRGLNYNVEFSYSTGSSTTTLDGGISFTNSTASEDTTTDAGGNVYTDIASKAAAKKRVFSFKVSEVTSPLKITMTLVAPYYKGNGASEYTQAWMENQYVGYIKATITQTS